MVQTEQQYICIHQCLMAVLEGKENLSSIPREIHDNQGYEGKQAHVLVDRRDEKMCMTIHYASRAVKGGAVCGVRIFLPISYILFVVGNSGMQVRQVRDFFSAS